MIWNIQNGEAIFCNPKQNDCLNPQIDIKNNIVFWSFEKEVIAYDLQQRTDYYRFPSEHFVEKFSISVSQKVLAISNTRNQEIVLWNYADKSFIDVLTIDGEIQSYSLEGKYLSNVFIKEKDYFISIYDIDSLNCIFQRKERWRISDHKFCASTLWLAYIINHTIIVEKIKSENNKILRNDVY